MEGWAKFKVDSLNIQKIDEEDIVTSDSDTMSIGSFKSQLPFYFRLGGSYKFSEDLVVGKVLALKSSTGARQRYIIYVGSIKLVNLLILMRDIEKEV